MVEVGGAGLVELQLDNDFRWAKEIDPFFEAEIIQKFAESVLEDLRSHDMHRSSGGTEVSGHAWMMQMIEKNCSNALEFPKLGEFVIAKPLTRIAELTREYCDLPAFERDAISGGRRFILRVMRDAFEDAGVLYKITSNIALSEYTRKGDPRRIDFGWKGYRYPQLADTGSVVKEDVYRMYHALSFTQGIQNALSLGATFRDVQKLISQQKQMRVMLTAVTGPELNRDDEEAKFALHELATSGIEVVDVSMANVIANQAKLELRV